MKKRVLILFSVLLLVTAMGAGVASAATVEEKRADVHKLTDRILGELYEVHPGAKGAIQSAAGYAVFGNNDLKLGFIGSGHGRGIAFNNNSGQEIYMTMFEVGLGFGLGARETSVIFLFDDDETFNNFVTDGWNFGAQATLAASDKVSGGSLEGAVVVAPHVWVYQMTGKALAIDISLEGTKYSKDKDLN